MDDCSKCCRYADGSCLCDTCRRTNWEASGDHTICTTCKHFSKMSFQEPCASCHKTNFKEVA
jgi:hypothetical protein